MKKTLISISVIMVLLGIGLVAAGMNMLDWKFIDLDSETYVSQAYVTTAEQTEAFDKIVISLDGGNVRLVRGGDTVKIDYYEGEGDTTTVTTDSNTLTLSIRNKEPVRFFTFFHGMKKSTLYTIVTVPSNQTLSLDIRTRNGKITAQDAGTLDAVTLDTTNSRIELSGLNSSSLSAKSTNGKIIAETINTGTLSLNTTNGKITATGMQAATATLKSTNGKIELKSSDCIELTAQTTNGKIEIENTNAFNILAQTTNSKINAKSVSASILKLKSTNGALEFERLSGSDITLQTTNGKIEGEISGRLSDYSITSKTSNRSNNLGTNINPNAANKLHAQTSNGKINVSFSG